MLYLESLEVRTQGRTLAQVSELKLENGEMTAIIGPNGAGKSSLLKAVSGDQYYVGKMDFHGRALASWSLNERARHIGVLPQASQVSFELTAWEVVSLGLMPLSLGRRDALTAVKKMMKSTDCEHLADCAYPRLSGGEKQRVQLARVLLQLSQAEYSPLLLLDEPTSAQDLSQQHSVLQLVKSLSEDCAYSVLAVLHDLNHVIRYCDQCCVFAGGQLREQGSPNQVLREDTVEQYWGYRPKRILSPELQTCILL